MGKDKSRDKEIDIKDIEKIFDDLDVQPNEETKPYEFGQTDKGDDVVTIRLSNSTNSMLMIC